jgi:uncharacterized protein
MFPFLIRVLSALLLIWLFRRFLSVLLRASPKTRQSNNSIDAENHMVKDPICGMYMDSRLAVRIDRRNEAFYFCSEDCRNKYLNKPPGDGAGSAAAR